MAQSARERSSWAENHLFPRIVKGKSLSTLQPPLTRKEISMHPPAVARCALFQASIDALILHYPVFYDELVDRLPLSALGATVSWGVLKPATQYQYRSQLHLVAPTPETWKLLLPYAPLLRAYKLSYLELAFDLPCPTTAQAQGYACFFRERFRKKYQTRRGIVMVNDMTAYLEERKVRTNVIIYPRLDKWTEQPIVRIEWRLRGAAHIKEKIGVTTLQDLLTLDPVPFLMKYLLLEEINYERLGRWVNHMPPRVSQLRHSGAFVYNRAARIGQQFCRLHEIETAAGLRGFFKQRKEELAHHRGRRTNLQHRLLQLSAYLLERFFIPLEVFPPLIRVDILG